MGHKLASIPVEYCEFHSFKDWPGCPWEGWPRAWQSQTFSNTTPDRGTAAIEEDTESNSDINNTETYTYQDSSNTLPNASPDNGTTSFEEIGITYQTGAVSDIGITAKTESHSSKNIERTTKSNSYNNIEGTTKVQHSSNENTKRTIEVVTSKSISENHDHHNEITAKMAPKTSSTINNGVGGNDVIVSTEKSLTHESKPPTDANSLLLKYILCVSNFNFCVLNFKKDLMCDINHDFHKDNFLTSLSFLDFTECSLKIKLPVDSRQISLS